MGRHCWETIFYSFRLSESSAEGATDSPLFRITFPRVFVQWIALGGRAGVSLCALPRRSDASFYTHGFSSAVGRLHVQVLSGHLCIDPGERGLGNWCKNADSLATTITVNVCLWFRHLLGSPVSVSSCWLACHLVNTVLSHTLHISSHKIDNIVWNESICSKKVLSVYVYKTWLRSSWDKKLQTSK